MWTQDQSDFSAKTLDGVADDWPIDYATLAPFYEANDRNTGVSGLGGNPAYQLTILTFRQFQCANWDKHWPKASMKRAGIGGRRMFRA
ncbi:hypothetical protein NBRC116601_19100 [Cognatishimia sp. WU-CL00825]|uniref:hypothetical protein n=1 Tax=Cognatishimia sp. WU-CL00825 TaxID=3127658 RepID=UPI00310AC51C